jgi:hypothetical protein
MSKLDSALENKSSRSVGGQTVGSVNPVSAKNLAENCFYFTVQLDDL